MPALTPLAQKTVYFNGRHISLIEVNYTAAADTVAVDPAYFKNTTDPSPNIHAVTLAGTTSPTVDTPSNPSAGTVNVRLGNTTAGDTGRTLIIAVAHGQNTSL